MLVAVGTAWLFMWTQRRLDRWEGAVLVGGYVAGVTILAV
jgi:Ca2+/Na+ antiporter